jgi:hypothetical protein
MAFIEISNLNTAGSDLFADADSFLNELQPTDSRQIFGGKWGSGGNGGNCGNYGGGGRRRTSWKNRRSNNGGGNYGGGDYGKSGGGSWKKDC